MNHHVKRFLFKYYALISLTVFLGSVLSFLFGSLTWQGLVAIEAGVVSFAVGLQKQQLEEMRLFRELFETFNERYDSQNEELNGIFRGPPEAPVTEREIDALFNYFNLCAEEYFYFKEGFIHREVWQAWKNGMKYFRKNPRIKLQWDKELQTDSYYGINFDKEGD